MFLLYQWKSFFNQCSSTMCKDLPSALQWRSSTSLATCVEFFENGVVFSLCEDDASSLRRKFLPHSEQNFAVSSNFSIKLNGHSGFVHFIVFFFADSWASIVQLSSSKERTQFWVPSMYAHLGFLERRKLLPGKEPPRFFESIDRACAKNKKEECKGYLTNPHKGYLVAHSYYNRVGKQRTWAIQSKLIKSRTHYLYKSDAFEKQTVTLVMIKEKKRVSALLSLDTIVSRRQQSVTNFTVRMSRDWCGRLTSWVCLDCENCMPSPGGGVLDPCLAIGVPLRVWNPDPV